MKMFPSAAVEGRWLLGQRASPLFLLLPFVNKHSAEYSASADARTWSVENATTREGWHRRERKCLDKLQSPSITDSSPLGPRPLPREQSSPPSWPETAPSPSKRPVRHPLPRVFVPKMTDKTHACACPARDETRGRCSSPLSSRRRAVLFVPRPLLVLALLLLLLWLLLWLWLSPSLLLYSSSVYSQPSRVSNCPGNRRRRSSASTSATSAPSTAMLGIPASVVHAAAA